MKPRQEHERCENCPAWDHTNLNPYGEGMCAMHPPNMPDNDGGAWPQTHGGDWCIDGIRLMREGEHGARDENASYNNLAYYRSGEAPSPSSEW